MKQPIRSRRSALSAVGLVSAGALIMAMAPATTNATPDTGSICADPQSRFNDTAGSVHEDNILCMADLGLTEGLRADPNTYGPRLDVTRGQMASFIARSIEQYQGDALADGDSSAFDDVPTGYVHGDNINKLRAIGVVEGTSNSGGESFAPQANVTRAQMASFIRRALSYLDSGSVSPLTAPPAGADAFADDNGSIHEDNIDALSSAEIVEGFVDGTYRPGADVKRDQMASFVIRALAYADAENLGGGPGDDDGADDGTDGGVDDGADDGTDGGGDDGADDGADDGTDDGDDGDDGGGGTDPDAGNGTLDAPELLAFTITELDQGIAVFDFDGDVSDVLAGVENFRGWTFSGEIVNPTSVRSEGGNVVAQFDRNDLRNVVRASVALNTVRDSSGLNNPLTHVAVSASDASAQTDRPDLLTVGNFRTQQDGDRLVDFVFDENVRDPDTNADTDIDGGNFDIVLTDGTLLDTAGEFEDVTGSTVTLNYGNSAANDSLASSTIARGIVAAGTVTTDRAPFDGTQVTNVLTRASLDAKSATVGPDLVSAQVVGPRTIEFAFDMQVDASPLSGEDFSVYAWNGEQTTAAGIPDSDIERIGGDTISVTFAEADQSAVAQAVGAIVEDSAVSTSQELGDASTNRLDTAAVTNDSDVSGAGRTVLPDLERVTFRQDAANNNTFVRYTYDQPIEAGTVPAANHSIYSQRAERTAGTGTVTQVDRFTTEVQFPRAAGETGVFAAVSFVTGGAAPVTDGGFLLQGR